ncbi:hypothetical protein ACPXCH_31390, partial [Streptomyces albogriseolus]
DSETGPWGPRGSLSSNETRQKCSNSCAALGVTSLAPGILLPVPVYKYRKWSGQMTAQMAYDQLEAAAREHAWQYGRSLRAVLRRGEDLVHG